MIYHWSYTEIITLAIDIVLSYSVQPRCAVQCSSKQGPTNMTCTPYVCQLSPWSASSKTIDWHGVLYSVLCVQLWICTVCHESLDMISTAHLQWVLRTSYFVCTALPSRHSVDPRSYDLYSTKYSILCTAFCPCSRTTRLRAHACFVFRDLAVFGHRTGYWCYYIHCIGSWYTRNNLDLMNYDLPLAQGT